MKVENFRVKPGSKVDLKKFSTDLSFDDGEKEKYAVQMEKNKERIGEYQNAMYAQDIFSLLIIFQAMDAAGKDSTIEHVMTGVNPAGCSVESFKQPSAEEMDHDFLWRCAKVVPEKGKIGIFNRSHYEEVLVVRVHPGILQSQRLPEKVKTDKNIWKKRFELINNFEKGLYENGTHIVKFFLNVSRDEQKKRFLSRIEEPEKNWKFSTGDVKERALWGDYMKAYADAIQNTSTEGAPWYIIPADKKWFMRYAVSQIIADKLKSMKLAYPTVSAAAKADLIEAKRLLESEQL